MVVGLSVLVTSLIIAPFALDGDSATETGGNGEAIAVVSAISIVGGYLLLFALWRYVFSEKAKVKRREPPDRSGRG
jgi:hypothetical protein